MFEAEFLPGTVIISQLLMKRKRLKAHSTLSLSSISPSSGTIAFAISNKKTITLSKQQ
jgi:hypothetical protein